MAKTVIGLDIGTTQVRAVEVRRQRGDVSVLRYAEAALPLGAMQDGEVTDTLVVADALKKLWSAGKFSHREVVLGIGNQRVLVRNLELPSMPMDQLRSSLPFQVQDNLPVAVEDALLDFYPTAKLTGATGETLRGLLVAATRDTVRANVAAAESAGLRPLVVDLNAFALLRAHMLGRPADDVVALVDIGARITNVVVAQYGRPALVRTLPTGGLHLTDAVAGTMGVSHLEAEDLKRQVGVGLNVPEQYQAAAEVVNHLGQALIESIRNTLVFYSSNNPGQGISTVVLTGGGAHLNGLGQYLASASRLPVVVGNVLGDVSVAKDVQIDPRNAPDGVTIPFGLALAVAA